MWRPIIPKSSRTFSANWKSIGPPWCPAKRNTEMHWPFLALALVCAGFTQGMTGFGFGLVSMSLMPLVIGVKQAAAISTVFSFLATITTFLRHYREYKWRLGLAFLISVCGGVPIGVYFLDRASEGLLLRVLGGIMVLFAFREFVVKRRHK